MRLSECLARLEQRQHHAPIPCAYPSAKAAQAAGVRGGWLHIGATMAPDEWSAAARVQQAALCKVPHGNNA